jgi:MFS family permease
MRSHQFSGARWRGGVVLCLLVVDSLTSGLFVPMSLLYLGSSSGQSLAVVGLLLSAAAIASLPLPLWFGRLVDKTGARRAIAVAQVLQAVGAAIYLMPLGPLLIFLGALTNSAGQRIFSSTKLVLVSELTDHDSAPRARERWFAIVAAMRSAGYGVGALLAGLTLHARSEALWRSVLLTIIILQAVATVLVQTINPRRPANSTGAAQNGGYRTLWKDFPYLGLIGLNSLFALCTLMLAIAFPPFIAASVPSLAWAVGPLLLLNTVVQAAVQPGLARLVRKVRRDIALSVAGGLWFAWSILTGSIPNLPTAMRLPGALIAVLCYSCAQIVHGPVSNALAADAAPLEIRGRYLAAFQYSFGLAGVVAPIFFTGLTAASARLPWIALGVVAASAVLGSRTLVRRLPAVALRGQQRQLVQQPSLAVKYKTLMGL